MSNSERKRTGREALDVEAQQQRTSVTNENQAATLVDLSPRATAQRNAVSKIENSPAMAAQRDKLRELFGEMRVGDSDGGYRPPGTGIGTTGIVQGFFNNNGYKNAAVRWKDAYDATEAFKEAIESQGLEGNGLDTLRSNAEAKSTKAGTVSAGEAYEPLEWKGPTADKHRIIGPGSFKGGDLLRYNINNDTKKIENVVEGYREVKTVMGGQETVSNLNSSIKKGVDQSDRVVVYTTDKNPKSTSGGGFSYEISPAKQQEQSTSKTREPKEKVLKIVKLSFKTPTSEVDSAYEAGSIYEGDSNDEVNSNSDEDYDYGGDSTSEVDHEWIKSKYIVHKYSTGDGHEKLKRTRGKGKATVDGGKNVSGKARRSNKVARTGTKKVATKSSGSSAKPDSESVTRSKEKGKEIDNGKEIGKPEPDYDSDFQD